MNKVLKKIIAILFLILCGQTEVFAENIGQISGKLILDDSWERKIYASYIKIIEKTHVVSNDLIITSAIIDSLGNFKMDLAKIPSDWSLLRLHIVKKGITPNSLIIGSIDENYMFLIARRSSEIQLYNTGSKPIFKNVSIEGANYMQTFRYIKNLSEYPNTINYENSLIEKEFIEDAVFEKLKIVADTSTNPLVSLYAISQIDFQTDFYNDQGYYENYLSKWIKEDNSYFKSFRLKLPKANHIATSTNSTKYILLCTTIGMLVLIGYHFYNKRGTNFKKLSVKEREIFDLLRKGMTNKEISAECNIELTTVKSHVGSIYAKLKIKSRKEAMDLKTKHYENT